MLMRIRYKKLGGHYHCRVFTARGNIDSTFAKCGSVVFDEREWPEVRALFERGGAEVLEEAEYHEPDPT